MRFSVKHLALCLPCLFLVGSGCSMLKDKEPPVLKVMPTQSLRHGADRADAYYILGRYHQGAEQIDRALAAFNEAVSMNPEHAKARNARALILFSRGQHELAIADFERALAIDGNSASIRNNLGYAYLMQGRKAEAQSVLEIAAVADPDNVRIRENLVMARETALPVEVSRAEHKPKIEISNGNGVSGMAHSTAFLLKNEGYKQQRLTNRSDFFLEKSEIKYRPGFKEEASVLQSLLQPRLPIVESPVLRADIKVRLDLGKDVGRSLSLAGKG